MQNAECRLQNAEWLAILHSAICILHCSMNTSARILILATHHFFPDRFARSCPYEK
jgi:hypothetical protein